MSQILCHNKKLDKDLFAIEKKLCTHQHHKENLLNYKKNNKVPKRLLLKFNLTLFTDNSVLKEQCNNISFNASSQIRNKIMKALEKKIKTLSKERKSLLNKIKTTFNHQEIENIKKNICNIKNIIKTNTIKKQNRKNRRDNMKNNNNKQRKKNRRFDRSLLTQERKNKNKRRKENYRIKINEFKANAPDHNAINLSKCELTEAQKSLLMKGPSFGPTPSDVNWYEMRKD